MIQSEIIKKLRTKFYDKETKTSILPVNLKNCK